MFGSFGAIDAGRIFQLSLRIFLLIKIIEFNWTEINMLDGI
jgi:hypothetical protein